MSALIPPQLVLTDYNPSTASTKAYNGLHAGEVVAKLIMSGCPVQLIRDDQAVTIHSPGLIYIYYQQGGTVTNVVMVIELSQLEQQQISLN